jgi:hypothetical protein
MFRRIWSWLGGVFGSSSKLTGSDHFDAIIEGTHSRVGALIARYRGSSRAAK